MSRSGNVARGRPTVNTFNLHENYMMLSEPEERRIKRAVDAPRLVGRPMRLVITSRFLCFPIMSAARHVARRAARLILHPWRRAEFQRVQVRVRVRAALHLQPAPPGDII